MSCISEIGTSGSGCNATTCRSQTARSCSGWRKSHVKLSFVLLPPPPSCNISRLLGIYTGLRFCRLSFKGVPQNYSDAVKMLDLQQMTRNEVHVRDSTIRSREDESWTTPREVAVLNMRPPILFRHDIALDSYCGPQSTHLCKQGIAREMRSALPLHCGVSVGTIWT